MGESLRSIRMVSLGLANHTNHRAFLVVRFLVQWVISWHLRLFHWIGRTLVKCLTTIWLLLHEDFFSITFYVLLLCISFKSFGSTIFLDLYVMGTWLSLSVVLFEDRNLQGYFHHLKLLRIDGVMQVHIKLDGAETTPSSLWTRLGKKLQVRQREDL